MYVIGFNHASYAPHFPECESYEGYHCMTCNAYFETRLPSDNLKFRECDYCGKLATRVTECVCKQISEGGI